MITDVVRSRCTEPSLKTIRITAWITHTMSACREGVGECGGQMGFPFTIKVSV